MQKKLQDIAEIILGHTFRSAVIHDPNGRFSILQAKNINVDGSPNAEFPRISVEKIRSQGLVQNGDVILTNRGLFRASVYRGDGGSLIAAASVYLLRIKGKNIMPEFLAVFFNSRRGQGLLKQCIRGATIPSLPKSCLSTLQIPIPILEMQKLIVNINNNHLHRSQLYEKRSRLQKEVAETVISKLLTQ